VAQNIVHDSANWASLWVKEVSLAVAAGSEASLPGGSISGAIGKLFQVGEKVGIILDSPYLGADGFYHASIDTACMVRIEGIAGTGASGALVYITAGNAATLAVGATPVNKKIGYLDQAKLATGDDLWLQLVPGIGS